MRKFYSSPKLVLYCFLYPLLSFIIGSSLLLIFLRGVFLVGSIGFALFWGFFFVRYFVRYRNAFCKVWIDEIGIHSNYVTFDWSKITNYKLLEVSVFFNENRSCKIIFPSVVSIGNTIADRPFAKQKKEECIFFSLSPAELNLVEKYGRGKSEAIDDLLEHRGLLPKDRGRFSVLKKKNKK